MPADVEQYMNVTLLFRMRMKIQNNNCTFSISQLPEGSKWKEKKNMNALVLRRTKSKYGWKIFNDFDFDSILSQSLFLPSSQWKAKI